MEIDLKEKRLLVEKKNEGIEFLLLPHRLRVVIDRDEIYKVKAALDAQFFGTLKRNIVVHGLKGYLVFFKGKDRWGLRLSDGKSREAVYLSRLDVSQIKHFLGG